MSKTSKMQKCVDEMVTAAMRSGKTTDAELRQVIAGGLDNGDRPLVDLVTLEMCADAFAQVPLAASKRRLRKRGVITEDE